MAWLRGLVVLAVLLRFLGVEAILLLLIVLVLVPALSWVPDEARQQAPKPRKPATPVGPPKLTVVKGGKL